MLTDARNKSCTRHPSIALFSRKLHIKGCQDCVELVVCVQATSIARQMARQAKSEIDNAKVREALAGTTMYAPGPTMHLPLGV